MKNHQFYSEFGQELNCLNLFKKYYQKKLKECPNCKHLNLKWSSLFLGWRCCKCSKKISLKSISFMRDSNKSFRDWLEILHLVCHSKKSISINEIYRKSRQTRYETVYHMVQKIRLEFGRINACNVKEFHTEFIFSTREHIHFNNLPSSIQMTYITSKNRKRDHIRLIVPPFFHWGLINYKRHLIIRGSYPYKKLLNIDFEDQFYSNALPKAKTRPIQKKWKNQIRNNVIKLLKGTYHFTMGTHLQGVLDEYSFKYNYRHSKTSKIQIFLKLMTT